MSEISSDGKGMSDVFSSVLSDEAIKILHEQKQFEINLMKNQIDIINSKNQHDIRLMEQKYLDICQKYEEERTSKCNLERIIDDLERSKTDLEKNGAISKNQLSYLERRIMRELEVDKIDDAFSKINRFLCLQEELKTSQETIKDLQIMLTSERLKNSDSKNSPVAQSDSISTLKRLQNQISEMNAESIVRIEEITKARLQIESIKKENRSLILTNESLMKECSSLKSQNENMAVEMKQIKLELENLYKNNNELVETVKGISNEKQKEMHGSQRKERLLKHLSQRFDPVFIGISPKTSLYSLFSQLSLIFQSLSSSDIDSVLVYQNLSSLLETARIINIPNFPISENTNSDTHDIQALKDIISKLEDENADFQDRIKDFEESDSAPKLASALHKIKQLEIELDAYKKTSQSLIAKRSRISKDNQGTLF